MANGVMEVFEGDDLEMTLEESIAEITIANAWGEITGDINDQTDLMQELNGKVSKVTQTNKVYGTDSNGNQTTYDVDSFGAVSDVQIDDTTVVTNKVAKIPHASSSTNGVIKVGSDFDIDSDGTLSLYQALTLTASVSPNTAEKGSTVTQTTVSWVRNKVPVAVTVDGISVLASKTSETFSGLSITANKTYTVVASDTRMSKTATATLSFLNGIYYACSLVPQTYDSSFILGLGRRALSSTRARSVTLTATSGQYYYYAYPKSYGAATFKVDNIEGGFELAGTVSFTNASGYTEDYYVYKSIQHSLGKTTFVVS